MKNKLTKEIWTKAIVRAWKDGKFHQKLLSDPKGAFAEMGVEMPKDVDVKVIEEKGGQKYLLLPKIPVNFHELSDAEVEKIYAAAKECKSAESVISCFFTW